MRSVILPNARTQPIAAGTEKKRLALCVQPMLYVNHDISLRLVEWLEILRQQKYDKVFLYVIDLHPNMTRVSGTTFFLHSLHSRNLSGVEPL